MLSIQGWKKLKTQQTSPSAEPHVIGPVRLFYIKSRREAGLHNTLMHCRHSRIPTGKSRTQPFSGFVWSFISWSANYGGARHCTCQHIHREAVNVIQRHQVQTPETCEIALWRSSFFWNQKSWKLSLQDTYLSKHNLDMLAEAHITFLATQSWSDAKCTHCEVLMSQGHLVWHVSLYVRSWANRASRLLMLKSLKIISQIIKYIEHHISFHHWNMLKDVKSMLKQSRSRSLVSS